MNAPVFEDDDGGAEGGGFGALLSQLPIILLERKWWIIIPAIIGLIAAAALAFTLDKKYESAAILLVQAPSLPPDIIGNSADQAVVQRIEAIRQRIINRPALIGMIQQNDLYQKERESSPLSTVVEDMRDAIVLAPQQIDLGGSGRDPTISVRLSYTYSEPAKTQAVAQQLMERIVEVDSATSAEQLNETVQFLSDQQQDMQRRIAEAEGELAAFNTRYGSVLSSGSMTALGGGGVAYDMQISNLQREIADLEAQKRLLTSAETRDPAVVQAESALAAARATYTENHPDVVLAKQNLAQARAVARQNVERVPTQEIDTRMSLARNQIVQLQAAKAREAAQTSAAMSQRTQSPAIQQQAAQMQQRVSSLNKQAEDISNRLLAARASQRASEEQMGERLLVVDPPVVPDRPVSPNRPLIIAAGALGGLALGFILAFGLEILRRPIRDPGTLARIIGVQPMGVVPVIPSNEGKRRFFFGGRKKTKSRKARKQSARASRRKDRSGDQNELLNA